jgi:hypothetical protein
LSRIFYIKSLIEPANGFPFSNFGNTPTIQPNAHTISNTVVFNQQPTENQIHQQPIGNKIHQQPLQTTNVSSITDLSKTISMNTFTTPTSTKGKF